MNTCAKSKKEVLENKVVALVKEFVKTEGGVNMKDIEEIFGLSRYSPITAALMELPISIKAS